MRKLFVYLHGPHKSSLFLTKEFCITESFELKKPKWFKPFSTAVASFFDSFKLKGYDLYFFEGSASASIAPMVKTDENKLIVKGNDQVIFFMETRPFWRFYFKKIINLEKYIDGVIAVSDLIKNDYLKYFDMNIEVAEGFIYRDIDTLRILRPNFKQKNFIMIGSDSYLKGVDYAVKLFVELKENGVIEKNTRFYLIGGHTDFLQRRGFSLDILKTKGVIFVDFTDTIEKYISDSLFQIHLARYEPNSVAVMEGMVAGLIPIVSSKTGNKSFISRINENLILDTNNYSEIYKNTVSIFTDIATDKKLKDLSDAFREAGNIYNKRAGLLRWKRCFERLTENKWN